MTKAADIARGPGTTANSLVALDGTAKLPAVDASLLTNVPGATVNITTYTSSSGTWTKRSVGTFARVRLWAGGGSGAKGVSTSETNRASGGGGGQYVEQTFRLSDLNATESYSVGAGGSAITATVETAGNAGGNTTFKNMFAIGGYGGVVDTKAAIGPGGSLNPSTGVGGNSNSPWDGGDGTTGEKAGRNAFFGGAGGGGGSNGTTATVSSAGGTSQFGGNGGAGNAATGGTAGSGTAPGGGGGGKYNGTTGSSGAGANGRIEIWVW